MESLLAIASCLVRLVGGFLIGYLIAGLALRSFYDQSILLALMGGALGAMVCLAINDPPLPRIVVTSIFLGIFGAELVGHFSIPIWMTFRYNRSLSDPVWWDYWEGHYKGCGWLLALPIGGFGGAAVGYLIWRSKSRGRSSIAGADK